MATMSYQPLDPELTTAVLHHLAVTPSQPDLCLLDQLVAAYTRTVPWESAFRIVKKAGTAVLADCPRWPEEFWRDNLQRGGGGTCFESNYAFFRLLLALGFDGYLTINDMGDSIGCHTAIIVWLDGQKWLADVGLPLFAPLPVSSRAVTHRASPFIRYTVRPDGPGRFQIKQRPHRYEVAFMLIDRPVAEADYRAAATADYDQDGLFLDAVIVNKVVDGLPWRFNGRDHPPMINSFSNGQRMDVPITGDPATAVARHFGMDESILRAAFAATASPSPPP